MKYSGRDIYRIETSIGIPKETLLKYLSQSDEYKNRLLANLKIEKVISTICKNLTDAGIKKDYMHKIIEAVFRNDALIGLWRLVQNDTYKKKIKNTIEQYENVLSDPHSFYIENKGSKHFRKYGSLSLSYTNTSPIHVIQKIMKDSKEVSSHHTEQFIADMEQIYGNGEYVASGFIDFIVSSEDVYGGKGVVEKFDNVDFTRLEQALLQDIKGSGIPETIILEFQKLVGYGDLKEKRRSAFSLHTKRDFLDGMFHYFQRLEDKKSFIHRRTSDENFKAQVIEDFLKSLYNEPYITPRLIEMQTSDFGTHKFELARQKRLQGKGNKIYTKDNIASQLLYS